MSLYVVFTILAYLMLLPTGYLLWASVQPPRLRAPVVVVDPRAVTTDSEHWGLI